MIKKIQFPAIKKAKLSRDKSAIQLKFDSPVIFDTAGTFGESKRPNQPFQWEVKKLVLKDPLRNNELPSLANQVGEKLELILEIEETQLDLYPKNGPHVQGFVRDSKKASATLYENINRGLEIELNKEAPTAITWIVGRPISIQVARQQAIKNLKGTWKNNSDNGSETGTINGKDITTVLGVNWESDFANQNTREDIEKHKKELAQEIFKVARDKEIKLKFTVKEVKEQPAHDGSTNNFISCKIKTEFLMSSLHKLELIYGKPQDAPFQEIIFIFDNERAKSEVYDSLADSEDETFDLNFNLSKICLEVVSTLNFPEDKPKIKMFAEGKRLEVFFRRADALSLITVQKTGESPNDETPKLNDLTNLLEAANSPTATDQDKIAALKKAGEFEGFISSENQTKLTQIKQQLVNKPDQLRQALSEKVENQLMANNLTINDLPGTELKTLYNNLKTGSLVEATECQLAERRLSTIIGVTGAKKTLDNLETQIRKVLSSSDKDEKLRLQKLLRKFIKSKNTFYQDKKPRIQQLNQELKKSIQENDFNQNSEIPWEKITILVGGGIIFSLVLAVIFNRLNKRKS